MPGQGFVTPDPSGRPGEGAVARDPHYPHQISDLDAKFVAAGPAWSNGTNLNQLRELHHIVYARVDYKLSKHPPIRSHFVLGHPVLGCRATPHPVGSL